MYEVVYNTHTYIILTFLPFTCSVWYFGKWTFLGEWRCHTARQLPWKAGQPAALVALRSRNHRPCQGTSVCNSQPRNASPSLRCPVRVRGFVFNSSQHVIPRAKVGVVGPQCPPWGDGCGLGAPSSWGEGLRAWRPAPDAPEENLVTGTLVYRMDSWFPLSVWIQSHAPLKRILQTFLMENALLPSLALTVGEVWLLINHLKFWNKHSTLFVS